MSCIQALFGIKSHCLICAPVLSKGSVVGLVEVFNKVDRSSSSTAGEVSDDAQHLSFSSNEVVLLNYISNAIGLALEKQYSFSTLNSSILRSLMESTCRKMDAERVSVFMFNPVHLTLVCKLSPDIEGVVVPHSVGFAGLSFTTQATLNISDAAGDKRHFSEVDSQFNFLTKSLLCIPFYDHKHEEPIGVLQAINKQGSASFTEDDEKTIFEFSRLCLDYMVDNNDPILSEETPAEAKETPAEAKETSQQLPQKPASQDLSLSVGAKPRSSTYRETTPPSQLFFDCMEEFSRCESWEALVARISFYVGQVSQCDYTAIYVLDNDDDALVTIDSTVVLERNASDVHPTVRPLLKRSTDPSSSMQRNFIGDPMEILPGISLQRALVLAIPVPLFPYANGFAVLVLGERESDKASATAWELSNYEILDSINHAVKISATVLSDKFKLIHSSTALKKECSFAHKVMRSLSDFVILLNADGDLINCNRDLSELLGECIPADGAALGASSGRRRHYSHWLNDGHSPELRRDISLSLQELVPRKLDRAKFFSSVFSSGTIVDYRVDPIVNTDSSAADFEGGILKSGYVTASAASSEDKIPSTVPRDDVVLVVIIHVDDFNTQRGLHPHHPSLKGSHASSSSSSTVMSIDIPVDAPHLALDAASRIVNTVLADFKIDLEDSNRLKDFTVFLDTMSRKITIGRTGQQQLQPSDLHVESCKQVVSLALHESSIPDNLKEWDFDALQITNKVTLCSIIGHLFATLFDLAELSIDASIFDRYIIEVGKNYHDRPFHNLQHSVCVTHFTFMLIHATAAADKLSTLQLFGLLLGAVVHDIDHPGNTNLFEVNSRSELALQYNNLAVLENHHCSFAFRLMRQSNMNILGRLTSANYTDLRRFVVSCILASDMSVHFDLIEETKKKGVDNWKFAELKDQQLFGKIILHAADLSNPVRPFHITKEWARRISIEFNDQYNREVELGMPTLAHMTSANEIVFCKNEKGFASFVVAPMWRAIATCFPTVQFLVQQVDQNIVSWQELADRLQDEADREGSN